MNEFAQHCVLEPPTLVVLLIEGTGASGQMMEGGSVVWERSVGTTRLCLWRRPIRSDSVLFLQHLIA